VIHVTVQQLSSYLDDQLAGGSADIVRQHLAACPECDAKLGALSRMDAALTRALSHDPGEDVYLRLEREIASALGPDASSKAAEILAAAPARVSAPPAAPARTATSKPSSAAPPRPAPPRPAAASATRDTATGRPPKVREVPATAWTPSTMRAPAPPPDEPRRERGSSAGTWIAVFSLALIAGSVGVVVSHSGTVQGWLDSLVSSPNFSTGGKAGAPPTEAAAVPESVAAWDSTGESFEIAGPADAGLDPQAVASGPSESVPVLPKPPGRLGGSEPTDHEWDTDSFAEESAPVPQTMRADEVMASPDAAAASGRARGGSRRDDPYANLRPETQASVREAERVHQQTLFQPTAEQFDMAALRWEKALEGMNGPEQVTVRGRLADARFRAWELGPTDQRADAALSAIRSYLLFAPPGIAREESKARLERITPR
jgi:Putative zinc-finger